MSVQKPVRSRLRVSVVQVRQPESCAELVREDAHAAVLRLDGVVADPVADAADLDTAEQVLGRTGPSSRCRL